MPADTATSLSAADFDYVRRLVLDKSSIVINPDQSYLVETRLAGLARREGFTSITQLVSAVRDGGARQYQVRVVEAMTTNETSFFRDHHPFEALRTSIIPDLIKKRAGTRRLIIWCAACSTGQEPYSVAMLLREHFPTLSNWNVEIYATDLSMEILEKAKRGRYTQLEVNRWLPAALLIKYFTKIGTEWQIKDEIRSAVRFEPINLTGPWQQFTTVDLVLLRNVLIYFDVEVKKQILKRSRGILQRDGYLMLGGAETTFNLDDGFERVEFGRYACYRPRSGSAVLAQPMARMCARPEPLSK